MLVSLSIYFSLIDRCLAFADAGCCRRPARYHHPVLASYILMFFYSARLPCQPRLRPAMPMICRAHAHCPPIRLFSRLLNFLMLTRLPVTLYCHDAIRYCADYAREEQLKISALIQARSFGA